MDSYLLRAARQRGLILLDAAGNTLAGLERPRWWSQEALGLVGQQRLELRPTGTWRRDYTVLLDGRPEGLLRTGPWGRLHIELPQAGGPTTRLIITHLNFWRRTFALKVEDGPVLATLQPVFNWRAFATDLHVAVTGSGIPADRLPLLLVLAGFGARLVMARRSAAA